MVATQECERIPVRPTPENRSAQKPDRRPVAVNLESLAQYIYKTLPLPETIAHLDLNIWHEVVQFSWEGRRFVVKPSLETFELKGHSLFVTAASILVQTILVKQKKHTKVGEEIIDALKQVEYLLLAPRLEPLVTIMYLSAGNRTKRALFPSRIDAAVALLESVKRTVQRLLQSREHPESAKLLVKQSPLALEYERALSKLA
jgi:hypothetical protein